MPQKVPCKVAEIIPHGERVYTVLLRPQARLPRVAAGQFLHLALDAYRPGDFWPESRVFSIASSPSQTDLLRITYAVKAAFTTRMETELAVGGEVWVKLPYGEFIVARDRDVCLLAGGTGITAFTAFLDDLPADHPHEVHVFYGARTPDLLIYRSLVERFAQRCRKARLYLYAEQIDGADDAVHCGRLDVVKITCHLVHADRLTYYVAGPPAMIRAATAQLPSLDVPSSHIMVDAWE
jgi:ferredoxin-NADP reductase